MSKRTRQYLWVGALAAMLCVGALFFVWFARGGAALQSMPQQNAQQAALAVGSTPMPISLTAAPSGDANIYTDTHYGFSLQMPQGLSAERYDEGGGASTFTFQNVGAGQGFQIFIVPYSGAQISDARFKEDEPSGVRTGAQNISIGGVPAVSFYSTNLALGDTAEIWFIRSGYLYEVTTLKPLAGWLSQIMQSWKFTN